MSTTVSINHRLHAMNMTAEARARALQAAYIGESIGGAASAVGRTVARLYRWWRDRRDLQHSIAYLERLDDRLLADIGLSRASLEQELHNPSRVAAKAPAVEPVIGVAVPAEAANQDHRTERHAA